MSDEVLSSAALALTYRVKEYFPRDVPPEKLAAWNRCPKEILTDRLRQLFESLPEPPESILEFLGTTTIAARQQAFVAHDHFIVDTSRNAKVKISHLGFNFAPRFLAGPGKIEPPIPETTLRYYKLRQATLHAPLIAELGGERNAETTLADAYSLMEKQRDGSPGVLVNTGWANIFYVRDLNGSLCAVNVHWGAGGWDVLAQDIGHRGAWSDGDQVFSRDSVR